MRELTEIKPAPITEIDILRHGIWEIATLATGSHVDPCYPKLRQIKDFAGRILDASEEAAARTEDTSDES